MDAVPAAAALTVRRVGQGARGRGVPTPTGCAASASARRESSDISSDPMSLFPSDYPRSNVSRVPTRLRTVERIPEQVRQEPLVASTKVLTNRAAVALPGIVSHNLTRTPP